MSILPITHAERAAIPYSTKLLRDKTFVVRSPCEYPRRNFAFASKQCSQVLKHFEIRGKTFAVQAKSTNFKTTKVLALERFVLYGMSHCVAACATSISNMVTCVHMSALSYAVKI